MVTLTFISSIKEDNLTFVDLINFSVPWGFFLIVLKLIQFKQEKIDKAMDDYELIEEFYYNLSTDDFNAK